VNPDRAAGYQTSIFTPDNFEMRKRVVEDRTIATYVPVATLLQSSNRSLSATESEYCDIKHPTMMTANMPRNIRIERKHHSDRQDVMNDRARVKRPFRVARKVLHRSTSRSNIPAGTSPGWLVQVQPAKSQLPREASS